MSDQEILARTNALLLSPDEIAVGAKTGAYGRRDGAQFQRFLTLWCGLTTVHLMVLSIAIARVG